MLVGNYVFYLLGVQHTTPANAQLLIQLAPLLMALGGIWVFGERFRAAQWLGLALLVAGMGLFFADQLADQRAGAGLRARLGAGDRRRDRLGGLRAAAEAAADAPGLDADPALHLRLRQRRAAAVRASGRAARSSTRCTGRCWRTARSTRSAPTVPSPRRWRTGRPRACRRSWPSRRCCASPPRAAVHALWPQWLAPERITPLGWLGAALVVAGSAAVSLLKAASRPTIPTGPNIAP